MPEPIGHSVPELPAPHDDLLEGARAAPKTGDEHERWLSRIPALHLVEQKSPARPARSGDRLTVASFNGERLKFRDAAAGLLDRAGAQATFLAEADVGMARSGNAHTVAELAARRGEGWVFGTEFVELDLGDSKETRSHEGERNSRSLHGNAILTGLPLVEPFLIPLQEGGLWFAGRDGLQRRVGRRMAVAARVADAARPLWLVSVHLESKTDAEDRAAQILELLRALDRIAPGASVVIGGDLNTKELPPPEEQAEAVLRVPERWEPLFGHLRAAGFGWEEANLAVPTQRTGPSGKHTPPFRKLDWIVTRGTGVENPRVIPALDAGGSPISDHEMLAVDIVL